MSRFMGVVIVVQLMVVTMILTIISLQLGPQSPPKQVVVVGSVVPA